MNCTCSIFLRSWHITDSLSWLASDKFPRNPSVLFKGNGPAGKLYFAWLKYNKFLALGICCNCHQPLEHVLGVDKNCQWEQPIA